jgi:DNA (cytosine-5)-methyltransferase 1
MGLSAIDLFCGAGGLSAGFVQEGYDLTLGIDFDPAAVETYAANFGADRAEHADLLEYTASDVRKRIGGTVDVILGGPSCQPFSTHGRHQRWVVGDPRSDLWSRMFSYVDELRPRAFVMENVPGMLYFAGGNFVESLANAFRGLGYTLNVEMVLAADYNVPQLRRRLIVVGVLGERPFKFPDPPRLGGWRRDSLAKWERERIARNLLPHITLRQALGSLPEVSEPGVPTYYSGRALGEYDAYMRTPWRSAPSGAPVARTRKVRDHERVPIIEEVRLLARHVPPGGTWRDIPPHLLPERFRSMRRTDGTNLYGRMTWDRPAYTMTTQFQNITTGCFIHPDENRPLTIREGARVQSFSDDFQFVGGIGAQMRLIGNAVPPLLARSLARQLKAHLESRTADEIEPLVVGPADYRGIPVPGGAEAVLAMRSGGKHDDAAKTRIIQHLQALEMSVESHYTVPGTDVDADLALVDKQIAIFVHGCFIYGCPQCARGTKSQTWWKADINRRVAERTQQVAAIENAGWTVAVVWEHEDPATLADRLGIGEEAA